MQKYHPHRPCISMDEGYYGVYQAMETLPGPGDGLQKLNCLMETLYPGVVFQLARELRLPIIDLSRSFDIYDEDLYRCQIEPGYKGSQLIARLVTHVIAHHDFLVGESSFYYLRENLIFNESNTEEYRWNLDQ